MSKGYIGIDLGGTKTEIRVLNEAGKEVLVERINTSKYI
jgi:predicted NBD/HSP70 family sugar kinase